VQHDEQMVGVRMDLGHPIAFDTVTHREWMEFEDVRKHVDGIWVALRDVDPHHHVAALEQHTGNSSIENCSMPRSLTAWTAVIPAHPSLDQLPFEPSDNHVQSIFSGQLEKAC
jgi:hypothetical protein